VAIELGGVLDPVILFLELAGAAIILGGGM
jgi:hypothetical protein